MKNNFIKLNTFMLLAIGTVTLSNAQIVGGVSYLKGKYVEVAISDCGTYASGDGGVVVAAPAGYHANNFDGSLGFTNDVGQDGWDLGVPDQCGDYVMPGSPEEGWAIQFGGTVYGNLQPYCYRPGLFVAGAPSFAGGNITNINTGAIRKSIWQGTNTDLGIAINQTSYFLQKKQAILTIVDICNGGDEITDLYYARNTDPDNDQVTTGSFLTTNQVKKQYIPAGYSQVSASSSTGSPCYMAYVTGDARGKASRGNFSMGNPADMYNGVGGYVTTGTPATADEAIQISFKMDTLKHNDCNCIAYSSVFTTGGIFEQVTLSNTACATLGTLARFGDEMVAEYLDDPAYFLNNEFVAYPNPSTGNFTINMFEMENANITVLNAIGDVVYSAKGVNKIEGVYIENAVPGIYFVTVEHDGKTNIKSIVIE